MAMILEPLTLGLGLGFLHSAHVYVGDASWGSGPKGRGWGGKTVLFLWRSPYELVLAPGRNPEKAFWRLCKRCCTAEKEGRREGGGGEEGGRKIRQYKSGLAPVGNQISLKRTRDRIMESKVGQIKVTNNSDVSPP